jgi:hypothetical protein
MRADRGYRGRDRARRDPRAEWEAFALDLAAVAWRCRVELGLLAVVIVMQVLLGQWVGGLVAGAVVLAAVGGLLAVRPARHWITRLLHHARVRRAWDRAVLDARAATGPFRGPRVLSVTAVAAGDLLRVRVRRGSSVSELDERREQLAACLRVREVRVLRDRADGALATVALVRRDPFEDADVLPWPNAGADEVSLWDSIPVGVDEHGERVEIGLVERNVLIGGEPGAGKSAALSTLVATAALDPDARVWLLDGKLVELAVWAPVAEALAGPDGEQALALLRGVREEMDARYRELLARGQRKVRREDGLPLDLVVCDELAFYLTLPDKRQRQEFAELLRDLVARGRAAGVIVIAATQKPGADTVPTALRDLFGFRLALRCNTPQASDTILGQGWASAGADASVIPGGQRGVGYLLAEGERPARVKGFYLDDSDVRTIAERATARRADAWLATTGNRNAADAPGAVAS